MTDKRRQDIYQALREFRNRRKILTYLTPEKIASLAYNSSKVDGVDCNYDNLLNYARELMREQYASYRYTISPNRRWGGNKHHKEDQEGK